jgi:GNAT superfamily N-acetyltransferase
MQIREMKADDHQDAIAIALALPQWFTKSGLESIRKDIRFQTGLVAVEVGKIIGFVTFFVNQGVATIGWMGVLPEIQRSGVGLSLLQELKLLLQKSNVRRILVSTLGDSVDYEPYARTRSFYRKFGFADFQHLLHPENPEQEEELILSIDI